MSVADIVISIIIALAVNLATPLVRRWLVSGFTRFKVRARSAGFSVLNTRLRQLEDNLSWYRENSEPKQLLKWLFPRLFEQIVFLWVLVLLPYFIVVVSGIWDIPEAVSKGGLYGIVGLCSRYFVSFFVVGSMAHKALFFADETEEKLHKQINEIKARLG